MSIEARSINGATRPVSLLEGEDPGTGNAIDARHWIAIYAELVAFSETLLAREEGAKEIHRRRAERFRGRLEFWQGRHWELVGLDLDLEALVIRHNGRESRLTKREAQLLHFLLAHPERHFTARTLTSLAWQDPELAAEQVRTYVVRLRRKLIALRVPCRLVSETKRGYALTFEPVRASAAPPRSRSGQAL